MAGACICETPNGKIAKIFLKQNITLNGLPQTVRTNKGTAFTDRDFRDFSKSLNIRFIYGPAFIHTPTGSLETGIEILKDFFRPILKEGKNINEALSCSMNTMSIMVHSSINEAHYERHYCRKPRTELHNYFNISPKKKQIFVSAKLETLQIYTFSTEVEKKQATCDESTEKVKRGC